MKKLIALILCVLMAGLTGIAAADEPAFTLTAPSGAPAVAVARMALETPEQFTFVAADTIAAAFAAGEADFIIAPVNAGAKLFKAGKSDYRLAAVITWGNLVFASQKEGFTMADMNGAKITLFGENTINASVALFVLAQEGIVPAEVEYLAGAAQTQQLLISDPEAMVMTAEPAATAARMKNDVIITYAVTDELQKTAGKNGFAQAGLFVRGETLAAHPEEVKTYLARIQAAAEETAADTEAVAKAAVALEILPNEKVAMAAIPGCSIRYEAASDAREMIEFTAGIDMSQFGGEVPGDDFYYAAE